MSTLSVPLDADMLKALERLVHDGIAPNKAEAVRQALRHFIRAQAIEEILRASKEPRLKGNLHELAKKIK